MLNTKHYKCNYQYIQTRDSKKIRACIWSENHKGLILFLNGRNEYIEKYNDIYLKFQKRGYAVITLDWRGQGLSEREKKFLNFGHVNNFSEYQTDLECVLDHFNITKIIGKKFIVCHSTGCLIGLRFLQNKKYLFDGAIFFAPLWGGSFYQKILSKFCIFLNYFGLKKINLTKDIKKPYVLSTTLEKNCLTSDYNNYRILQENIKKNPQLDVGPPSLCWIAGAASEIIALKNKIKLKIPNLIFFGENDIIISYKDIKKKLDKKSNKVFLIKKGRHELLIERKEITDYIWKQIDKFI